MLQHVSDLTICLPRKLPRLDSSSVSDVVAAIIIFDAACRATSAEVRATHGNHAPISSIHHVTCRDCPPSLAQLDHNMHCYTTSALAAIACLLQYGLAATEGRFEVTGRSGVPAMHAALLPNGRVVFLDKLENYTEIMTVEDKQRYAYSSLYDPIDRSLLPLSVHSNAFCSGGAFLDDGTLLNMGGNSPLSWLDPTVSDGFNALRFLDQNRMEWVEPGTKLDSKR